MDSNAKLNILTDALAAAGASALAIDARGDVAISTMNDAALERDVAAFVAERLDRIGDGARLVMGREGTRLSLTVRPTDKEGGRLWVVVVREALEPWEQCEIMRLVGKFSHVLNEECEAFKRQVAAENETDDKGEGDACDS